MKVGFLQVDCIFGKKERNRTKVADMLRGHSVDLLVLPELFNTGYLFSSTDELADLSEQIPDGETTQFLIKLAKDYNTIIVAGIAEKEGNNYYNSAVCVSDIGFIGKYRKIHLFDREKLWFQPGNSPFEVFNLGHVKIGMMICFDWIFPESARSLALKGANIICHPANLVLPYCQNAMVTRCLENRVFAITANRIGTENRADTQLNFTGASEIVAPDGDILVTASVDREEARFIEIDPLKANDKNITLSNNLFKDRRTNLYY